MLELWLVQREAISLSLQHSLLSLPGIRSIILLHLSCLYVDLPMGPADLLAQALCFIIDNLFPDSGLPYLLCSCRAPKC